MFWQAADRGVAHRYATFVEAVVSGTVDLLDHLKQKSVRTVFEPLMAKPEQEKALLTALVNKLGDPSRKLASKVGFFLHSMLAKHPLMKVIVAREVEGFIFRPVSCPARRVVAVITVISVVLAAAINEAAKACCFVVVGNGRTSGCVPHTTP